MSIVMMLIIGTECSAWRNLNQIARPSWFSVLQFGASGLQHGDGTEIVKKVVQNPPGPVQ